MSLRRLCLALVLAAASFSGFATDVGNLSVTDAWARSTVTGQKAGAGYLKIVNRGGAPDRLVAARTPAAQMVELHTMSMDGDVMRMRQVDGVELPAGKSVEFRPGGLHLMLMGLKAPLAVGETVPLTLKFEKAGEVTVSARVQAGGN